MKILAIDPSSTCCGWAVLSGTKPTLLAFGLSRAGARHKTAVARMDAIALLLVAAAADHRPDLVVMEWTGGRARRGMESASTLAIIGQAQGTYRAVLRALNLEVHTVHENDWTASVKKAARAERVAYEFPAYRDFAARGLDKGHDVADAIGLGAWWLRREHYAALAAGRS